MSIDLKFVELKADVLEFFYKIVEEVAVFVLLMVVVYFVVVGV